MQETFGTILDIGILGACFFVILYIVSNIFMKNPAVDHSKSYKARRAINWLPLGLTYAFLYMGRYNLTVSKIALGSRMSNEAFGFIFGFGAFVYFVALLFNGPLTDRIGGKRAILIGASGAAFANILMGIVLYGILAKNWALNLTFVFIILYALNMYFQSFGAVAIVKVNSGWFHVRERGVFGGIFGILISLGIYLAFDWGTAIVNATLSDVNLASMLAKTNTVLSFIQSHLRSLLGVGGSMIDQTWWVFLIPAAALIFFAILDLWIIRDMPSGAGFKDIYTADASAGEEDTPIGLRALLRRILTNKIILTIALIEFCTGIIRQGIMQWYPIFIKSPALSDAIKSLPLVIFMQSRWGGMLMIAGVLGGMIAGMVSDKIFRSRRGPVAGLLYAIMFAATMIMIFNVFGSQNWLAIAVVAISFCVIGTHGVLSGTSTMDFGGQRAAATAVGLIDGSVYLGTWFQSFWLGIITTHNWKLWPVFLVPFTLLGFYLAVRIWGAIPVPKAVAAKAEEQPA
jgi:OPA family glycerol-3-phosphate transporter-like MFS transporter